MERHIGTWHKENNSQKQEVAELIIDGNHIEFYSRFHGEVFPCTFIGSDGQYRYKVFVKGTSKPSSSRLLEYTSSHRVYYVLMQNFQFSKGLDISGIKEFSFTIPELINWLGVKTVSYGCTDMEEIAAYEEYLTPIVINAENPYIELYFESKTFNSSIVQDDRTSIIIRKEPRIKVTYGKSQEVQSVLNDIECLMQFFGLLIGSVSIAEDIRLSIDDQDLKSWLFFNFDFSYNTMAKDVIDRPRTYLYVIEDNIQSYYSNWRKFYFDDTYALLRRIFFSVNDRKDIFAEDIFVQYMRILDGYHTRISGDEETKKKLKEALKASTKKIKKLIFSDEGRPLFEDAIKKVIPDWKYNSAHMEEIAGWIAAGYLAKTPLSHRLQELDSMYLSIIAKNSVTIEKKSKDIKKIEGKSDEELKQLYFKELGDTRNYYSHYKLDKTGVLEFSQMTDSIDILKATIISIFLSHMGMEKELIRKIMAFDSELSWQTMCLRNESDQPFKHPNEVNKVEQKAVQKEKKSVLRYVKNKIFRLLKRG